MAKNYVEPEDPLWQAVASIAEDEGLMLYDLERLGELGLRVVLGRAKLGKDALEAEVAERAAQGGVTSGDCSRVCRRLMVFFSVEGVNHSLPSEPQIEVSSPGINRELRRDEHFLGAVGERVTLVPKRETEAGECGLDISGPVTGVLEFYRDDVIGLVAETSGKSMQLPRQGLRRAYVDFKF